MKKWIKTEDRLNPEELWQHLQDAWRNLAAKLPEKLCSIVSRTKAFFKRKWWSHQIL